MAAAIMITLTEKVSVTPGRRAFRAEATAAATTNATKRSGSSQRQWAKVQKKIAEPDAMMANRYRRTSHECTPARSEYTRACMTDGPGLMVLPVRWCPKQ